MSSEHDAGSELEQTRALLTRTREDLKRMAQQAVLASQLAATAHDLRNSVGFMTSGLGVLERYIRDMAELLGAYAELEPQLEPQAQALLKRIKESVRLELIREDSPRILEALSEGARRTQTTLNEFLDQARSAEKPAFKPCDLVDLLRRALKPIRAMHWEKVELVQELQPVPLVTCNAGRILRMFENLVLNAIQAIPAKGHVWVALRQDPNGQAVVLEVRDDGTGIAEEHRSRLFEPFFSTKPPGVGIGLGLTISRDVAEEHGGTLQLRDRPGGGTVAEVVLPPDGQKTQG